MKGQLSLETLYAVFVVMALIMLIVSVFSSSLNDTYQDANTTGKVTYLWYQSVALSGTPNFHKDYTSLYYGAQNCTIIVSNTVNGPVVNNATYQGQKVPVVYPNNDFFRSSGHYREVW